MVSRLCFLSIFLLISLGLMNIRGAQAAQCGFGSIDLSSVTSNTDITGSDSNFNYYLNLCGTVNDATCVKSAAGVMLCQSPKPGVQGSVAGMAYYSKPPSPVWSYLGNSSSSGLQAVFSNGDSCYNPMTGSMEPRQVTFTIPCASSPSTTLTIQTQTDPCHYIVNWASPAACPGGGGGGDNSSSGLSGGWIFVIALLVSAFLYIVVGCVYKAKSLGAEGLERCPNIDFWKDLPGLVKDGFVFTWTKLRGLCSGGKSSSSSYDTL